MASTKLPITSALLFGPKSRRFGFPKAFLPWGQGSLASHLLQEAHKGFQEVLAVAKEPKWIPPDAQGKATLILDRWPLWGPLVGLASALPLARYEAVYLTACLRPHLGWELAKGMWTVFQREGPFDAVVPYLGGQWKPLNALWHRTSLPTLQPDKWASLDQLLEEGGLHIRRVSSSEMEKWDPGFTSQQDLESLQDWAALMAPQV